MRDSIRLYNGRVVWALLPFWHDILYWSLGVGGSDWSTEAVARNIQGSIRVVGGSGSLDLLLQLAW
jgi:hypothetical protein